MPLLFLRPDNDIALKDIAPKKNTSSIIRFTRKTKEIAKTSRFCALLFFQTKKNRWLKNP